MSTFDSATLKTEFDWLATVIDTRLRCFFADQPCDIPAAPTLPNDGCYPLDSQASINQRIIFALALARELSPATLDPLLIENTTLKSAFTEFGGLPSTGECGFIPSIETALFLCAGNDVLSRAKVAAEVFGEQGLLAQKLLHLQPSPAGTYLAQRLCVGRELAAQMLTGSEPRTEFSADFPAQRLTTGLEWEDLVLGDHTLAQINHLLAWLNHEHTLLKEWDLQRSLAAGYRALFHGPPGTGKTLTAALLGKATGRPVFRIDLSMVVSKYIGETEKNLARVFDRAGNGNWILFFDEADALFGKRTQTSSAQDRFANQEVSYLLQRIENNPGLTILATNLKGNLDSAFSRRFQSLVTFTRPDEQQRLQIWRRVLGSRVPLDSDVDLAEIASNYPLCGGEIVNVVRYAAVAALGAGRKRVSGRDIQSAAIAEQRKDGRDT